MSDAFDAWYVTHKPIGTLREVWDAGRAPLLAAIKAHNAGCASRCEYEPGCYGSGVFKPLSRCPNCPMDDVIDVGEA